MGFKPALAPKDLLCREGDSDSGEVERKLSRRNSKMYRGDENVGQKTYAISRGSV